MTRNCFKHSLPVLLGAFCVLMCSHASAINFVEIARFDVGSTADTANPENIGNNPSAVAWSGDRLYIAGFNSNQTNTAIVEITNPTDTGSVTATYGPTFGVLATPGSRGYSGLDILGDGSALAAAYDDGGADPNGIQQFDPNAGNSATAGFPLNARGGSGVGYDPGFGGSPVAVGWGTFGSGRIRLNDSSNGAVLADGTNGPIYFTGSSFIRDSDFDPDTGDIYVRAANDVIAVTRTGAITGSATEIVTETDAPFVAGQNIGFLSRSVGSDAVIYNERSSTGLGQTFDSAINVVDPSGAPIAVNFALIGGPIATGNGYYDFDFDVGTQTLALLDFANRNVHIFSVIPEPSSCVLLALGLAGLARRSSRR